MKGHFKKVQSHYRSAKDSIFSRFQEREVILFGGLVVAVFLLIAVAGPFIWKSPSDLRGAAPTPTFEFDPLEEDVFDDIPGDHRHAYALSYLKSRGMIHGFQEDNTFRPDEVMNRAVFLKMVTESLHAYPHGLRYSHCYADVGNEWFAPYVCYGVAKGWIDGGKEGEFKPGDNLTRGVGLKILMSAYGVETDGASGRASRFEDVRNDSPYVSSVVVAEEKGWLKGLFDGPRFEADTEMTRAQVAELLFRIALTELPNF